MLRAQRRRSSKAQEKAKTLFCRFGKLVKKIATPFNISNSRDEKYCLP
jgi:hypothetical protein